MYIFHFYFTYFHVKIHCYLLCYCIYCNYCITVFIDCYLLYLLYILIVIRFVNYHTENHASNVIAHVGAERTRALEIIIIIRGMKRLLILKGTAATGANY